ncbi:Cloroperoxidase [Lactarius pseudohatsudake]|nr:Cloroperoxidase [Lactarius pseudohatsudake]
MSTPKHSFIPPSAGDSRSPCPALNALANHGILPHDGRGITAYQLISVMRQHYHVSLPLATFLSIGGTFICDGRYAPVTVDSELLQNLLDSSKNRDFLTFEDLVRVRAARDQSLHRPLSRMHGVISRGEVALTLQALGDSEGRVSKQFIREWFGDQRLPEGWLKPVTAIGLLSTTRIANRVADLVKEVPSSKKVV